MPQLYHNMLKLEVFKGCWNIIGHFWQHSEVFGKLFAIFGSGCDVAGNPGHDKMKIEQTNNNTEIAGHADQQLSLEWSHLVPYHRLKSLWLPLGYCTLQSMINANTGKYCSIALK